MPPPSRVAAVPVRVTPLSAGAAPQDDGDCRCGAVALAVPPGAGDVPLAWLAHLYLCEGLSTYRVGQLTGLNRQRVTRLLHRAGVPLRPRGAGGSRPQTRARIRRTWRRC